MSFREILEEARRERRRKETEGVRNLAIGTVLGSLIGGIAGVLFAPKSGKETRQDIADAANQGYEKAGETIHKTVETAKDKYAEVSEVVKDKYEEVSESVKDKYAEYSDRNMIEIPNDDLYDDFEDFEIDGDFEEVVEAEEVEAEEVEEEN